ncbi:MAG: iron ABC transporter permease [Candidatus Omnitrophica bacterium]|nr:iron ABC transporter permease [Candidatus Omnitrophota bacterium]
MRIKAPNVMILLLFLLLLASAAAIMIGSVSVPVSEIFSEDFRAILMLRLSRIILAGIAGASLAVVGAILQGLLKNPLADPYVLGISSGAGLGAVVAIASGVSLLAGGSYSLPFFAFLGGILATLFVYFISKKAARVGTEDLLLSGVIVAAMLSGLIMFVVSTMETEGMHSSLWWLLGNTQIFDMKLLTIVSVVSIFGIAISILLARNLNIMSLGEEEAIAMGLNVERIKIIFFAISSLITAAVVSVCGLIGFVGLIIPHVTRRLVGPDHRSLIPASALCGATFLILCDILARKLMSPMGIPIGVITAIVGGPFFIILLKKARRPQFR